MPGASWATTPVPSRRSGPELHGEQRQYFVDRWGGLTAKAPIITTEIQNNCPQTSPFIQMRLNELAVWATVEYVLG